MGRDYKPNNAEISLFQEQFVAEKEAIINLNAVFPISMLRDDTQTDGTGAVTHETSEYRVRHQAAGDFARIASAGRGVYVPGIAAQVGIGVRIPAAPTTGDGAIRWGYFDMALDGNDENTTNIRNGFLYGVDKDGLFIEIWKSGTLKHRAEVANDELNVGDGSWIDLSKGWIFQIDYAYYGHGPIIFSVQAPENADASQERYVLHAVKIDNETSMDNSNLQVGAFAKSSDTSEDFSAYIAGRQFSIVGNYKPATRTTGVYNTGVSVNDTTWVPIASFRRKASRRETAVVPFGYDIEVDTDAIIQVRVNSTLTGASWGDIDDQPVDESSLERDISASEVDVTTGTKIYEALLSSGQGVGKETLQKVEELLTDTPDEATVTFAVKTISGTGTAAGVCRMRELY